MALSNLRLAVLACTYLLFSQVRGVSAANFWI